MRPFVRLRYVASIEHRIRERYQVQLTLYSMYSTAIMEIMFTSPMGTEKRSRESSVGILSCIPPKKRRVGRGRDGKRPFGRRVSETVFFVNGPVSSLLLGRTVSISRMLCSKMRCRLHRWGRRTGRFWISSRIFSDSSLSLVHAAQDAIRLSNEDEWIHYFMLSMYSMMLSFMHRMSGVVYGNLDFDHKGR